jgi:hypothetical protein
MDEARASDDRAGDAATVDDEGGAGRQGVVRPLLDSLPGLVRRARRRLGMSQRDLAAELGVSQSRVARWETGRTIPSTADLEEVLALSGVTIMAVDEHGEQVVGMNPLAVRDRADRHYPAHCDPRGEGWWAPPGSLTTVEGAAAWRRSRDDGVPRVTYDRGGWRALMRFAYGTPTDHPTQAEVVAAMERETMSAAAPPLTGAPPETGAQPSPPPD